MNGFGSEVCRLFRRFLVRSRANLRDGRMDGSDISLSSEGVDEAEVPHEDLVNHKYFFSKSEFLSLAQNLYQQRVIPIRLRKYVCEYASLSNAEAMDAWYAIEGNEEEGKEIIRKNKLKVKCPVTESWLGSISEEERKLFDQVGISSFTELHKSNYLMNFQRDAVIYLDLCTLFAPT